MLSIQKCRELIPDEKKYADAEIEKIRNSLYEMAELALECYSDNIHDKAKTSTNHKDC